MIWEAEVASNLALIKYMGKISPQVKPPLSNFSRNKTEYQKNLFSHLSDQDQKILFSKNLCLNPSLSYTLNHFVTKVAIEESDRDQYTPFKNNPFENKKLYDCSKEINLQNKLSKQEQKKFLDFFQFLKRCFVINKNYKISSQNNFPISAGVASSASSFASLTLATYKLAKDQSSTKKKFENLSRKHLAQLSRTGSGSSCRSFFSPWCLWTNQDIKNFKKPWDHLLHQLIVVDIQTKSISSTQAHTLVQTSPHFTGRKGRAEQRLLILSKALNTKDWEKCFQICREEFLDLHSLFETSIPSFFYKTALTKKVLDLIDDYWKTTKDGPLMTMDAGANVHLLYRPDQIKKREEIKQLLSNFLILSSIH